MWPLLEVDHGIARLSVRCRTQTKYRRPWAFSVQAQMLRPQRLSYRDTQVDAWRMWAVMRSVKWYNAEEAPDQFAGDDMRSELVQKLRRALEEALPDNFGTTNLSRDYIYKKLQERAGSG